MRPGSDGVPEQQRPRHDVMFLTFVVEDAPSSPVHENALEVLGLTGDSSPRYPGGSLEPQEPQGSWIYPGIAHGAAPFYAQTYAKTSSCGEFADYPTPFYQGALAPVSLQTFNEWPAGALECGNVPTTFDPFTLETPAHDTGDDLAAIPTHQDGIFTLGYVENLSFNGVLPFHSTAAHQFAVPETAKDASYSSHNDALNAGLSVVFQGANQTFSPWLNPWAVYPTSLDITLGFSQGTLAGPLSFFEPGNLSTPFCEYAPADLQPSNGSTLVAMECGNIQITLDPSTLGILAYSTP
ncbi:hypothetical protein ACKVWC_011513 [Pyricularia oryzae]